MTKQVTPEARFKTRSYPKIQSIYKRDEATNYKTFTSEYSTPEIEFLARNNWIATEKIDGTNIRLSWSPRHDGVQIQGRTDKASIPAPLFESLSEIITEEEFDRTWPTLIEAIYPLPHVTLYGEGYGPGIQRGGGRYTDVPSFALFDIRVNGILLPFSEVQRIGRKDLGLHVVDCFGEDRWAETPDTGLPLIHIENMAKGKISSHFGDFPAEGVVARPFRDVYDCFGNRVITKVKAVDYDRAA